MGREPCEARPFYQLNRPLHKGKGPPSPEEKALLIGPHPSFLKGESPLQGAPSLWEEGLPPMGRPNLLPLLRRLFPPEEGPP